MIGWIKRVFNKSKDAQVIIEIESNNTKPLDTDYVSKIDNTITEIIQTKKLTICDEMRLGRIKHLVSAYVHNLEAAIFSGTRLKEDSEFREFCHSKVQNFYSIDEVRKIDTSIILNKPKNYNIFIDMGCWCGQDESFCRHHWSFCSLELAGEFRPDLDISKVNSETNKINESELRSGLEAIQEIISRYELSIEF